jgi:hypothetical protein
MRATISSHLRAIADLLEQGEAAKQETQPAEKKDSCTVTVDRSQSLASAIESLKFDSVYVSDKFKEHYRQPWGTGTEEVEIELFTLGRFASNEEAVKAYEQRNLVPDVLATAAFIKANLSVLDEKGYVAVNLPDSCYVAFSRRGGGRRVGCGRCGTGWNGGGWFAGRPARKS